MTNQDFEELTSPPSDAAAGPEEVRASVAQRTSGALRSVGSGVATLGRRLPGTVRASGTAGHQATAQLQRLPDSTLRWIAATSVGLAAGLRIAGAPRLVTAAGAAPALLMGAAIALRPTEPGVLVDDHADEPAPPRTDLGQDGY
jgi:hypothetical protein